MADVIWALLPSGRLNRKSMAPVFWRLNARAVAALDFVATA